MLEENGIHRKKFSKNFKGTDIFIYHVLLKQLARLHRSGTTKKCNYIFAL